MKTALKKTTALLLAVICMLSALTLGAFAMDEVYLNVADFVAPNTGEDVADALQQLIEDNPNRTLFFADGEYMVSKPLCTPADPRRSVSLKLADFAVLKATGDWEPGQAVVRLGAIYPANDTHTNGSNYSFEGGIIDGSGVADGISIDGGRETMVRSVSIKHTVVGLHILYGANGGSSDADIHSLNIIGTGTTDSIGILIEGYDNTLSNIRIGYVYTGVQVKSSGNHLQNIHPLYYSDYTDYVNSCGFLDEGGSNWFDFCYSDQFGTAFRTTTNRTSIFHDCFCYWYSSDGDTHIAFRADKQFNSVLTNFTADLPSEKNNYMLLTGGSSGTGVISNPTVQDTTGANAVYLSYTQNLPLLLRLALRLVGLVELAFIRL